MSDQTLNSDTHPEADVSDWFGQPRGLTVLFLTEMWEKFSFYGMRALLVYYMVKGLEFSPGKASIVYGSYTALVYLTPIFGGLIADRFLGRRKAVLLGGSIMAFGHFIMSFDVMFYPALLTIALGNGLFLPNLPSQITLLYDSDDPRKGSAFNVYYMGVNLGAFLAPFVCGTLGEALGWHYGFGAAGVGMCIGLCIYYFGQRYLPRDKMGPQSRTEETPDQPTEARSDPKKSGAPIELFIAVIVAVVLFRGAYEQIGNTIAMWADTDVDRMIGTFEIPATWFQALNPLLVFLLTPPLVIFWTSRGQQGREPSPLMKMALGAAGLALGFLGLMAVSWYTEASGTQPTALILVLFISFYTLAELLILPVGLDLFSRLASANYRATTIAAWFLAAFFGNLLAGVLGSFWDLVTRQEFFLIMAGSAFASSLVLYVLDRRTNTQDAEQS